MPVELGTAGLLDAKLPLLYLAEGVVWDDACERLRWVEISSGTVYDAALTDDGLVDVRSAHVDETVGAVLPAEGGGLVIAGARHVHYLGSGGEPLRRVEIVPQGAAARLNDATVDPLGRVLVGTAPLEGAGVGRQLVASIDPDGDVRTLLVGLNLANGMDFDPEGSTLFAVDSIPGRILAIPYDVRTGEAGPADVIWTGLEIPDGLTVDAEGRIWVAFFGSGQVRCLDRDGTLLAVLDVPAPHPTCPTFAGPNLDRLIVTTAREKLTDAQLEEWPLSGGIFVADVAAVGCPVRRARLGGAG